MLREIQFLLTTLLATALAFAPVTRMVATTTTTTTTAATSLQMMDSLSDLASSGMLLAEAEPWVQPLSLVLDPALNLLSFAMVRLRQMCFFVCVE